MAADSSPKPRDLSQAFRALLDLFADDLTVIDSSLHLLVPLVYTPHQLTAILPMPQTHALRMALYLLWCPSALLYPCLPSHTCYSSHTTPLRSRLQSQRTCRPSCVLLQAGQLYFPVVTPTVCPAPSEALGTKGEQTRGVLSDPVNGGEGA